MKISYRYLISFVIHLYAFTLSAQNENNYWCFGRNVGMNFNNNPPTFFQTNMNVMEGCTSVSDAAGGLLFYTSGYMVYDKFGNPMPNTGGLLGNGPYTGNFTGSSKHGVSVVRNPQNPDQYYLFTANSLEDAPAANIYYSIIDMTLNTGLGDVTAVKNYILTSGVDESISIVRHSDCNSFWLLTTTNTSIKTLRAFAITGTGINTTPVSALLPYGIANNPIKAAKHDSLLLFTGNDIYTYSFDKSTGQISNPLTINTNTPDPDYLEFSADEAKLYGCSTSGGNVVQWDFSLWPNVTAISASATDVGSVFTVFGGIRRGPDGKIYLRQVVSNALSVINNPSAAGIACNFVATGVTLPAYAINPLYSVANFVELGNPYLAPLPPDTVFHITDSIHCFAENMVLSVDTGYTGYTWNSGATTNSVTITQAGNYWVRRYKNCKLYLDTFHIQNLQTAALSTYNHDTSICGAGTIILQVPDTFDTYIWNTGQTTYNITVQQSGAYWCMGYRGCWMTVDSFFIEFKSADTVRHHDDIKVCFESSVTLQAPGTFDQYSWNNGNTMPTLTVNQDGIYTREAFKGCDARHDSFEVRFVNFDMELGNDTAICPGVMLSIGATVPGATYLWQDGNTASHYTIASEGLYTLKVSVDGCTKADSVYITSFPLPSLVLDQGDTLICRDVPLLLNAKATGQGALLWSTGATNPAIHADTAGIYTVTYTDRCGVFSESVVIGEFDCNCTPFVPNAFSPNGDGINDIFKVELTCPVQKFDLFIYNRYGEIVFHSRQPGQGWDGYYKGNACDISTYFYYFTFTGYNNKTYYKKGDLTLLH